MLLRIIEGPLSADAGVHRRMSASARSNSWLGRSSLCVEGAANQMAHAPPFLARQATLVFRRLHASVESSRLPTRSTNVGVRAATFRLAWPRRHGMPLR